MKCRAFFRIGALLLSIAAVRLDRTGKARNEAVDALGKRGTAVELGGSIGLEYTF